MLRDFELRTERKTQAVEITSQVRETLGDLGDAAAVVVWVPHTTAGIIVQEHADPAVGRDLERSMAKIVSDDWDWEHIEEGDENPSSHVRAALTATSIVDPGRERRPRARHLAGDLLLRVRRAAHAHACSSLLSASRARSARRRRRRTPRPRPGARVSRSPSTMRASATVADRVERREHRDDADERPWCSRPRRARCRRRRGGRSRHEEHEGGGAERERLGRPHDGEREEQQRDRADPQHERRPVRIVLRGAVEEDEEEPEAGRRGEAEPRACRETARFALRRSARARRGPRRRARARSRRSGAPSASRRSRRPESTATQPRRGRDRRDDAHHPDREPAVERGEPDDAERGRGERERDEDGVRRPVAADERRRSRSRRARPPGTRA